MNIPILGIRHHGPGCARSLLRALDELSPDCLLVEGPPEAESVLAWAVHAEIEPPVALLLYCPDDIRKASFFPFAEFSPEWQAIRFGLGRGLPVRLIDLPQAHELAMRDAESATAVDAPSGLPAELPAESGAPAAADSQPLVAVAQEDISDDPLDWLGRAAGYGDGETWWNHLVEERRDDDGTGLFGAIQEAMTSVRAEVPRRMTEPVARREALREAAMRKGIRQAEKDGFQRIVVVCGAWHAPALAAMPPAKSDNQLLKGLPKVKVAATWAPWTYGRLAAASGYGAGVVAPGWYEFLWRTQAADPAGRAIGWISKVARFLRERDIDCSSAHVIEAVRLSNTLAALRDRPAAGLQELNEAVCSVICLGDDAPLRLIHARLLVGQRLGRVPPDVPAVPLQQDLTRQQRSLRLKPEALAKTRDLDLRRENDLQRSHLLHRLNLLDIPWGEIRRTGYGAKGTFHEVWQLQWQPEFAVAIIEASRWGGTILDAATAASIDRAERAESLPVLSELVDQVLLANLPQAVPPVTRKLENLAAVAGDASQLLEAIPPLANIFRYGNVRQTDASLVGHVLDGLVTRACISLGVACASLDDEAAAAMRRRIVAAHQAIKLIGNPDHSGQWLPALTRLAELGVTHGLVCGLAARLLLDEQTEEAADTALRMSRALSIGNEPAAAAAWLEGFLDQSGIVLLHDDRLWQMVDGWLGALGAEDFTRILPLVRRTFSQFSSAERTQLGARARHIGPAAAASRAAAAGADWNPDRARKPLPVLQQILGVES